METTVAESASVQWRWVFMVEWKVPAHMLALQRPSRCRKWEWDGNCEKCGKSESYLGGEAKSPLYRRV